jgi:hypothetical protein
MKVNGSAAHPDTAKPPAIPIPETLPLPDAAAVIVVRDIGRAAVVAIAWSVIAIAGAVIAWTGKCAGAGAATAETARVATAASAINVFLMASPFSWSKDS